MSELTHDSAKDQKNLLARLAAKGVMWSGISNIFTNVLRFVAIAVLAHFLTPRDFGVVALAYMVIEFMIDIGDLGVGPALVQKRELTKELLSTCFWLINIGSFFLCGLLCLSSNLVAIFFKEPMLSSVLIGFSFSVPIWGMAIIPHSLLQKELKFLGIGIAQMIGGIAFGIISILLAIKNFGVWSIVVAFLAQRFVTTVFLWYISSWKPSCIVDIRSFKKITSFSWNVLWERITYFFSSRLDYIIVGKLLGSGFLGFYMLAFEITSIPQKRISALVSGVAFPAFSKIQDDNTLLQSSYLKVIRNVALITIPSLALVSVLSFDFVKIVYGEKWLPCAYPISILCIAGMFKSVMNSNGSVFYSKGRADIAFKWALAQLIILLFPLIIGAKFGIVGVSIALSSTFVLLFLIIQPIVNSLIGLAFKEYFRNLYHVIIASGVMAVIIMLFKIILKKSGVQSDIILFILPCIISIIIYIGLTCWLRQSLFEEIKTMLRHMLAPAKD